ncbi:hypothetical protein [Gottfriedia luciferensis]|uniref:hypothetical protein n=1 Tax=Gottfriedia luciferensis TaxID=178774 RepID=UPI000B436BF5|nr:hypothetical protein [Gottfriedia luciferensis]
MSKLIARLDQNKSKKKKVKFKSFLRRFSKTQFTEESPSQILHNELRSLQKQLELKEINFIHAESEYIDVAIMELEAIRTKYSITVRQLKKLKATCDL